MKTNTVNLIFILLSCYSQANNNIDEKHLLLFLNDRPIKHSNCESIIIEVIQQCFKPNYSNELSKKVDHFINELELQRSLERYISTEDGSACKSVITPLKSMIISKKYSSLNHREKAKSIISDYEEGIIPGEIFNFLLNIVLQNLSSLEIRSLLLEYSNNKNIDTSIQNILSDLNSANSN